MTIANDAIRLAIEKLPLRVLRAEWRDPVLLLHGAGWRMTVTTTWRLLFQGRFVFGSDNIEPEMVDCLLTNNLITDCRWQSSLAHLDPLFVFSCGHVLEVFSVSAIEPWLLSFGDENLFVASPSE